MHTSQNNLHTWISAYIQECKVQRQLSPHTVKNYQRQLQVVVKQTKLQAWTDLTPNIAKRVMQQGNKDGLSARTINLRLTVLRNFCRYLVKQKVIKNNPLDSIHAVKQNKPLPKYLNVDEASSLLEFDGDDFLTLRDKCLFEIMYGCGLRLSELTNLSKGDLLGDGTLKVTGKGNKQRTDYRNDSSGIGIVPIPNKIWHCELPKFT